MPRETPNCIVPSCTRSGVNDLGIRLRRRDTTAWWARETAAHVCDTHARSGSEGAKIASTKTSPPGSPGRVSTGAPKVAAPSTDRQA